MVGRNSDLFESKKYLPNILLLVDRELSSDPEKYSLINLFSHRDLQDDDLKKISDRPRLFILGFSQIEENFPKIKKLKNDFVISFGQKIKKYEDSIIFLDKNDRSLFVDIIYQLNIMAFERELPNLLEDGFLGIKDLMERAQVFLDFIGKNFQVNSEPNNPDTVFFMDHIKRISMARIHLDQCESLDDFEKEINQIFADEELLEDVRVLNLKQMAELHGAKNELILPLITSEDDPLLFLSFYGDQNTKNLRTAFLISYVYELFFEYMRKRENDVEEEETLGILERAFDKIPFPVALIGDAGQLVLHNKAYTNLQILPGECLQLPHGHKFEKSGTIFLVERRDIKREEGVYHLFIFNSDDLIKSDDIPESVPSSEELGIISSSIAHELKNPLAGILAALDYLDLEDDWSDDLRTSLKELRESANRSKELVEIFLGFSKADSIQQNLGSVDFAFSKALDLLRFRMIESDIYLNMSAQTIGKGFEKKVNLSVVTIIFYLILSEVMTEYSHFKLISLEKEDTSFEGRCIQRSDKIEMQFDINFAIDGKIKESRLLQYLVDLEGLILSVERNKVVLGEWTLT